MPLDSKLLVSLFYFVESGSFGDFESGIVILFCHFKYQTIIISCIQTELEIFLNVARFEAMIVLGGKFLANLEGRVRSKNLCHS